MEMNGEHHTPASHSIPGKEPWYHLSRMLSGSFEDEGKTSFPYKDSNSQPISSFCTDHAVAPFIPSHTIL